MPYELDYEFETDTTARCRGKDQTDKATCGGEYFGKVFIKNRYWAIVQWDDEEDPDLYKANHIMIQQKTWIPLEE